MKHLRQILAASIAISGLQMIYGRPSSEITGETQRGDVQEKIFLQTDKPGYVSGDTIRFRAWLLDAKDERVLNDFSRYLYVELHNPYGGCEKRVKIKERDGMFQGIIPLDSELPESGYTLGAYTLFMENLPASSFYRQPVDIASGFGARHKIEATLEGRKLTVRLTDKSTGAPVECREVKVSDSRRAEPLRIVHNRSSASVRVPDDVDVVKVSFDNYEKYIPLPAGDEGMRMELHPEGGRLMPGGVNAVAFRVYDRFGRWLDSEGYVENGAGERVAEFKSGHSGYGVFHMEPVAGEDYTAVVGEKRFALPAVSESGAALHVQSARKDKVAVDVMGEVPREGLLRIERRGEVLLERGIDSFPVSIDRSELGDGLIAFILEDSEGKAVSSRLIYNGEGDTTTPVLLQQDLMTYVDDLPYYLSTPKGRLELDGMLIAQRSERYEPVDGELKYPVEIGGEISGNIRSRWKGKPIEEATLNVIAPALNFGMEAESDANGDVYVNGFDWPDGTAFICQALGKKGQLEHNFTIKEDEFPVVKALPMRPELKEDNYDDLLAHYSGDAMMLQELVVTAAPDDEKAQEILKRALGVRILGSDDFHDRSITTYEEAIRDIPTLIVRNGAIVSTRAGGIGKPYSPVEIWIDGTVWTPPSSMMGSSGSNDTEAYRSMMQSTARSTANLRVPTGAESTRRGVVVSGSGGRIRGGGTVSVSQLSELEGVLPFSGVATIEYVPSRLALYLSNAAAHNGGALLITTKGGKDSPWNKDFFKQVHMPLGYQNDPAARAAWPEAAGRPDYTIDSSGRLRAR